MTPQPVDTFVPGFVGEPGDRTFYFQVTSEGRTSWYIVEKSQVAAFASESTRLLAGHGYAGVGGEAPPPDVDEPRDVAFRVGDIRLKFDRDEGLAIVEFEALDEPGQSVELVLTPVQLDVAARIGAGAVSKGRPRCPKCGLAVDPDGHPCPVRNGDLRRHQP